MPATAPTPAPAPAPVPALTPGPAPAPTAFALDHLSDDDLLASTRSMVGRSNLVLAALLAHLAEVEARGVHRLRACSSLYTYCVYELRMSEDAASRRAQAARLVRKFPVLLERIAAGELHLTGLLMLGPHLTDENLAEVLERAKHRTKKEIAALVRRLDPLPDVPAKVEALGPAGSGRPAQNPTWADFVASMSPVRELPRGERPRDWVPEDVDASVDDGSDAPGDSAPAPTNWAAPQRYKVQFTASEEYVQLLEEARDLLAHAVKGRAIGEVHLRAMRLLVEQLKKRKYAVTDAPRAAVSEAPRQRRAERVDPPRQRGAERGDPPRQRGAERVDPPRQRGTEQDLPRQRGASSSAPSRYIPARVRRGVWARDEGRCTYADERRQRCRETRGLELHHRTAFAKGGPPSTGNLTLRCKAHNDLAAEQDFGRDHVLRAKGAFPGPAVDHATDC